jgi:hypothetical protein
LKSHSATARLNGFEKAPFQSQRNRRSFERAGFSRNVIDVVLKGRGFSRAAIAQKDVGGFSPWVQTVIETLQPEELTTLHDAPKLLVEWSPRWHEFTTSIGPAFSRSAPRLAGEAPFGILPYRGLIASLLLEAFLVFVVIVIPREVDHLRPYAAPRIQAEEVVYYSADELPRTRDLSGAQSGASGHAGGQEAHHRTQTIHVARGASLAPKVVDAPNVKLPSSPNPVANLLALKSIPGPPPAEGLHSSLTAPSLASSVIAPAPANISRDQSRPAFSLNNSIIQPAPNVSSNHSRSLPALSAAVVAPAPTIVSEHTLYAPKLDSTIIAPAPNVSADRAHAAPTLNSSVIAPASAQISRDQARSAPTFNGAVISPAPSAISRGVSPSRLQMNSAIVPPPVSAPARETQRTAQLNLPAPTVVPPPPAQTSNGSLVSSIIGKLFGTQDVVPPPPTVSSGSAPSSRTGGGSGAPLAGNVIPPPPSAGVSGSNLGAASGRSQPSSNVIQPPLSNVNTGSNAAGSFRKYSGSLPNASNIVPPPPSLTAGARNGSENSTGSGNAGSLANNVIPPPPSASEGSTLSGSGRTGIGRGALGDVGSPLAPPKSAGGNSDNSGVVLSTAPGSERALPGSGGKGSLAMSPSGGDKPGLGGSGGGSGIGTGKGPGSGLSEKTTAENSGAGRSGTGHGSDPNARAGISPTPGPGGAGTAPTGSTAAPGVDIRGGSAIVNLPSFDASNSSAPTVPGRSSVKADPGPSITIVATSRSGGAFDFYGKLPGDNYTVYVDTPSGIVVMQFADADPNSHTNIGPLTGPQGLRTDLPANLPHARVVVKCRLDASGNLKNLQVLEPGPAAMTAKIVAALPSWKFRPATRGSQPIEVNALLGFNIDTNDRY